MTATNPFGFNRWIVFQGDGGDDISEDVTLGQRNLLTSDLGSQATTFEVFAGQNVVLVGKNVSADSGVGVYGESDAPATGGIGVAGACDKGWGVCGVATIPTVDPTAGFPGMVGVVGVGDTTGLYGQSRPLEGQKPSGVLPPPGPGIGIYGIGDVAGVFGDCDTRGVVTGGTGVVGESIAGKGVIGSSTSGADIGVYGQSSRTLIGSPPVGAGVGVQGVGDLTGVVGRTVATLPPAGAPAGVGVLGVGESIGINGTSGTGRGGVFASGSTSHPLVAQVQLVPATVPLVDRGKGPPPQQEALPPTLSRRGLAGDLVAVNVTGEAGSEITRLWFCIKSGSGGQPAMWAEISFSATVPGLGP